MKLTGFATFPSTTTKDANFHKLFHLIQHLWQASILLLVCWAWSSSAQAQNIEFTQGSVDSGLDNRLSVRLKTYPGRGAANLPITLNYASKLWRIGFITGVMATQGGSPVKRPVTEVIYAEHSKSGWTSSLDIPKVDWPKPNDLYNYNGKACQSGFPCQPYPPAPLFRVSRVYIHMPSGSIHELRESDVPYQDMGVIDMSGSFYAVDGSRMRFDSVDIDTGTLYLSDGTRYLIDGGTTKYIDSDGNTLNYNNSTREWTDTLGRVVSIPLPADPQAQDYSYVLPGVNGTTLTYTFRWKNLSNALTPNAQGQSPSLKNMSGHYLPIPHPATPTNEGGSNFPQAASGETLFSTFVNDEEGEPKTTYVVGRGQYSGQTFNPVVLAEIIYPNGMKYQFSYNIYGEIDKVIYPTGAHDLYQYNVVPALGNLKEPYSTTNRAVTQRQLSADGTGNSYATWQNTVATYWTDGTLPIHTMRIRATAPDNTSTVVYKHDIKTGFVPFGYEDPRNGYAYDERIHGFNNSDGSLGVMLRRKMTSWEMTTNMVPPRLGLPNEIALPAYRNVRANKGVSLILDTGGQALSKTNTYQYDATYELTTGLDLLISTQSHFATIDQGIAQTGSLESISPGAGAIARSSETTFLNNSTYRDRNILGLATASVVKDAGGQVVAKTETFFDEGAYPLLTYSDLDNVPHYTDPNTTVRGNATSTRSYYDIGLGLFLETHSQFDECGNVRNSWNERGIRSEIEYSSTYNRAYPTQATTGVPDPTGQHSSNTAFNTSSTFDSTTGLVVTTSDINGQVTNFSYTNDQGQVDPLNRLRKVVKPNGGWTKTDYNDTVGNMYVYTESKQDTARVSKGFEYFDALGRVSRRFAYDGGTTYIIVDTQYDLMGRVLRVSNPYRGALGSVINPSNHWTSNTHDPLGRSTAATFSDEVTNWTIQTAYQGVYTTTTDQGLKQSRLKVDALGRIVRVDEPDASGNLGSVDAPSQASVYDYDTLGNLIHIAQGGNSAQLQHRYFKYDALSRLTFERQVEHNAIFTASDLLTGNNQWSRKIVYDETINSVSYKGLLTSMYDARNVHTRSQYDQLNRIWQVIYSDGTPTLTNRYDQARTGYFNKGKLTEAVTAAVGDIPQTAQAYDFDLMGLVVKQTQTVDAHSYTLQYAYNIGGQLVQETYPSGRVINLGYDEASLLSNVNGGQGHTFINAMNYTAQGKLASMTHGNNVVYNYGHNSCLQLASLQATKNGTVLQKYEYKYGKINTDGTVDETKNNGQIGRIESWVGTQKQWQQRFDYDFLGRVWSASEYRGDNNQQTYSIKLRYDLFGNRFQYQTDNPNNPFTQKWVEAGEVSPATNRYTSSVTYDNAGNITADPRFRNLEYSYDANGRLGQSSQPNGTNPIKAVYDGLGQRVATKVNGVLTTVMVYDASGRLVAEYGQTTPVTASIQYVLADHQGSTRLVTGGGGAVYSRHDYQPFGEELTADVGMRSNGQGFGTVDNVRRKYAGMETDDATNMAHTLWRKYDGQSGRWTSPDPYGGSMEIANPQSFNRYTYVNNDPVNLTDPTGLMPYRGADVGWEEIANGFWGSSRDLSQPPSSSNNIGTAMARHDSIVSTGYDPGLGIYRGEVDVQFTPEGASYTVTTTLNNPTLEQVGQTMDSLADSVNLVAQRGGGVRRGSSSRASSPKNDPKNWRYEPRRNGGGTWRYTGPRSWRQGLGHAGGAWRVGEGSVAAPLPGVQYHRHHIFPQQFRAKFEQFGINIDRASVLVPATLHRSLHPQWNKDWGNFFKSNPRATQTDVVRFGVNMMMRHNLDSYQVVPYPR